MGYSAFGVSPGPKESALPYFVLRGMCFRLEALGKDGIRVQNARVTRTLEEALRALIMNRALSG